jgi:hypothetical protein
MLSIPDILDALREDFAARDITAETLFGGWKAAYLNGGNRVVFGMGDFQADAPGPANAPGLQFTDDPTNAVAARSLFTRVQSVNVWVHAAPPDPRDPKRSENAQKRTAELLHATLAGLYRWAHGSFAWGSGRWLNDQEQDFVYGSLVTFVAQFSIPVLDDVHEAILPDADASTSETLLSLESGEFVVSVTPAP